MIKRNYELFIAGAWQKLCTYFVLCNTPAPLKVKWGYKEFTLMSIHLSIHLSIHPTVSVHPSVGMVSKTFWGKNICPIYFIPRIYPCGMSFFNHFHVSIFNVGTLVDRYLAENGVSWVETCHLGQNRWPWNLTEDLENNRAPLCSHIKFYVSFHRHMRIQTGVTVRKRLNWVWPLRSWPSTSDLEQLHGYHFCYW